MPTAIEIIDETCNHYNLSNRAIANSLRCCYYTERNGEPCMCAVGRVVNDPQQLEKFVYQHLVGSTGVTHIADYLSKYALPLEQSDSSAVSTIFSSRLSSAKKLQKLFTFKEGYKGFPTSFWIRLQQLHDEKNFWTDTGISAEGIKYAESLKALYKNTEPVPGVEFVYDHDASEAAASEI